MKERIKKHLSKLGFDNTVYLELFELIEMHPQLHYFSGEDYHAADDLARWGFLQKIISPIYSKTGNFQGNNIYFCSVGLELKVKELVAQDPDLPF